MLGRFQEMGDGMGIKGIRECKTALPARCRYGGFFVFIAMRSEDIAPEDVCEAAMV